MAGKLLTVLPKRSYDFSNLIVGTTQQIVVAERIDISEYIDAVLAVRVNSLTIGGLNTIALDLYGDGFTRNDPSVAFRTSSPLFSSVQLSISPWLLTYGGTVRGQYGIVVLTATRGQSGTMNVTLSADLVLRSPDAIA